MKKKRLFSYCLVALMGLKIGFSQILADHDAGFKLSFLSQGNFELGAGYGVSTIKRGSFDIPQITLALTASGETYRNFSKTQIAPKISLEAHKYFIGGRLGWARYQNADMADDRFFAELGLSFFGLIHTGYGRYFNLQKEYNQNIPLGRFFLTINLPIFKVKD